MRVDQFSDEPLGHQSAIWKQREAVAFVDKYKEIFIDDFLGLPNGKS